MKYYKTNSRLQGSFELVRVPHVSMAWICKDTGYDKHDLYICMSNKDIYVMHSINGKVCVEQMPYAYIDTFYINGKQVSNPVTYVAKNVYMKYNKPLEEKSMD